jgi:hypothetical protein
MSRLHAAALAQLTAKKKLVCVLDNLRLRILGEGSVAREERASTPTPIKLQGE